MGLIQSIKSLFRKGAANIGIVQRLDSVLDHPKISMDPNEYIRIQDSLRRYEDDYDKIKFRNSNKVFKERDLSSINMMKKVANQYATVVFNEQCEINIEGEAADFISGVFEHNDFKKNFSKYLEPMFALGGLACRPYLDKGSNQIEFSWALADAFYPLQSNTNNISEGAFTFRSSTIENKKPIYYTLLEFHEWIDGRYVITNELYRSERSDIVGTKVPVTDLYPDLEESTPLIYLSRPLFAYLKPSGFNNINPYSPLGLGVCDNCKRTLDRINRSYDEFDQEIRRGRRRIATSEMLLNSRVDEKGQVRQFFDDEEDTFQIIPGSDMDDYTIKDLTTSIRTTEYVAAINHHLKTLEMETALSSGTFNFDRTGSLSTKTATEVVSENSQTYQTRAMQITEVEKFIKELVISVCELGKALKLYSGTIPNFNEVEIDFKDGAFTSTSEKLTFYQQLITLGYPVNKAFEKILNLPEDEALELYQLGLRQSADKLSGMMSNAGLPEEME
ncbi:MAG: phage portal protein [Enterococcus gallinarum]